MSTWLERPERKNSNPATKFLEWKSNDQCFSYWDRDKKENVLVPLPLKFVILEHYHTVKGWNDKSQSGIYANEVSFTGSEELEVKSFKGGPIAKGIYKEIKQQITEAGGQYHRSIYAVTTDLEIVNISLKGAAVSEYSKFIDVNGDNFFTQNWVEVAEHVEGKKGAVKYWSPVFKKSTAIKEVEKIRPYAVKLQEYMNDYMNPTSDVGRKNSEVDKYLAPTESDQETMESDVPF